MSLHVALLELNCTEKLLNQSCAEQIQSAEYYSVSSVEAVIKCILKRPTYE